MEISNKTVVSFFVGIILGCACAYVWTDDARIEHENQLARISQIVKHHYKQECAK